MKRWDILNLLISKYNYKSYLEIGVQDPNSNFAKIDVEHKVSVDPNPWGDCTFVGTSDDFFNSIDIDTQFDLIFIDGLHHYDQVLKDIYNSLNHLSEGGTIMVHDCLPITELMQERDDNGGAWTGDVWKAISILRIERDDLSIYTIDTDWGCGIIQRGSNIPYKKVDFLNYSYYIDNRNELLNVVTIKEFYSKLLFNE